LKEYLLNTPRESLTPEAQAIEKLFWILPKIGPKVRFKLNEAQEEYDRIRSHRDLITKARQKGFSAFRIGVQTAQCLGVEGTRAVLISHESFSTQRLFDRARFILSNLSIEYQIKDWESGEVLGAQDVPLSVELGRHSRHELYFPKTESTFYIGTAGARAFGRGDTITDLHISEYAWWEKSAERMTSGLFQAVPIGGTICIESTGNGKNNDFYFMCKKAEDLGYQLYFRPWWKDPEYQITPRSSWNPDGFEHYFAEMEALYSLTEPQLYWYWMKLLEVRLNLPFMQQEYPSCVDECFQATGHKVFPVVEQVLDAGWAWKFFSIKPQVNQRVEKGELGRFRVDYLKGHPHPDYTYVLGGDASGGTGNDDAAIEILTLETFEQVFDFASNQCDPVVFGHFIVQLGILFNMAYLVCEGNNHGIATHSIILQGYPQRSRIYRRNTPSKTSKVEYGFWTGETTKNELVGKVLEGLDNGLTIYGEDLITEMDEFEESDSGRKEGPQDGRVISLGLACVGWFKWRHRARDLRPKPPPPLVNWEHAVFRYDPYEWMMEAAKRDKMMPLNQLRH